MLNIPLINRNARPAPLLTRPPPPLDKLIPHMIRNPVILPSVKHKESRRLSFRRGRHLPQLVLPRVLKDGIQLRLAHVQGLQHPVPALEPLCRDGGSVCGEGHDVFNDPLQCRLWEYTQQGFCVCDEVGFHGGQAAQVVHPGAAL